MLRNQDSCPAWIIHEKEIENYSHVYFARTVESDGLRGKGNQILQLNMIVGAPALAEFETKQCNRLWAVMG